MKKKNTAQKNALAKINQETDFRYWKARAEAAEADLMKMKAALTEMFSPLVELLKEHVIKEVEERVDEYLDDIQIDSTIYRR